MVVAVVVVPVPGIIFNHHLIGHTVPDRHCEAVFLGHLYGRFLVGCRCGDNGDTECRKFVLLFFVAG